MLELGIQFDARAVFDLQGLRARARRANRRALFTIGGFVRTSARSRPVGIVKRKRPARPGQPWSSHDRRSRDVRFEVLGAESVRIGPRLFPVRRASINLGGRTAPQTWEHGGRVVLTETRVGSRWLLSAKPAGRRPTRKRQAVLGPFPVMRPALELNARGGKLAEALRDTF